MTGIRWNCYLLGIKINSSHAPIQRQSVPYAATLVIPKIQQATRLIEKRLKYASHSKQF